MNQSRWRAHARATIARVISVAKGENPEITREELLHLIDAAYPFGERSNWPYKCWLEERKAWIDGHGTGIPRKAANVADYNETPMFREES